MKAREPALSGRGIFRGMLRSDYIWWNSPENAIDGVAPQLFLDFKENRYSYNYQFEPLSSLITVTAASGKTFIDKSGSIQTAAANTPRIDYSSGVGELLLEGSATNLLLNTDTLSTQNVTVTAVAHTLSFTGTGTVTLSGASTAGPLVGTGANTRVSLTFTPSAGTLTCTVTGSVIRAQLETNTAATSYVSCAGTQVTRTADTCALTAAAYSVLSGTAGAVAARGVYPVLAAASSRLVAYGTNNIVGPRAGTTTQAENFNGTSSVFSSAGSGTWAAGFGAVGSWNAGNRSICLNNGTVTNDANGRGTAAAITIGPSGGMQAGQVIRLRHFVGWTLPTIATNTQIQVQARTA